MRVFPLNSSYMLLLIIIAFTLTSFVNAHGFISDPAARNKVACDKNNWTPQAGNSVGAVGRIEAQDAPFPDNHDAEETHGLCGDPWEGGEGVLLPLNQQPYMQQGPIMATYKKGQIIEIDMQLTVHHWGHFEFRICKGGLNGDRFRTQMDGQECLNEFLLLRPNPDDRED